MTEQIVGYYSSRSAALLLDFDKTSALMKDTLVAQFGAAFAQQLQRRVRLEYQALIPEIPYIAGGRARMLNFFLLITAQELAVYKAMSKLGKSPSEAWELCHRALRLRCALVPGWKRWLVRKLMFSKLVQLIIRRRARQGQKGRFGNFEIEYLTNQGNDFDLGVNYLRCGNLRFVLEQGGEAFAPYICMSDIALSDDNCDFRMTEGSPTLISSKTPEVQKTIDRIRDKEAEQGA
jgi:hypothetical protein